MGVPLAILLLLGGALLLLGGAMVVILWGRDRGARGEERTAAMCGDDYFSPGSAIRVAMTRAVSVAAPPSAVWPWLAQLGRGAGFYSYDFLDNGRKPSARHLLSWIPSPRLGDATAIGYLRHLEEGARIVWWAPGERFLGVACSMCISIQLRSEGEGARLVIRISADAEGRGAWLVLWGFRFVDSLMATKQLASIRDRAERYGTRREDPENPETGARDQYQLYEVRFAGGGAAGVPGREKGALWRQVAIEAGVIATPSDSGD